MVQIPASFLQVLNDAIFLASAADVFYRIAEREAKIPGIDDLDRFVDVVCTTIVGRMIDSFFERLGDALAD